MVKKNVKILRVILIIVYIIVGLIINLLKDDLSLPPEILFIYIGFVLMSSGMAGLLTNSVLFTRGSAYSYNEESIWDRLYNLLICLSGCFLALYFIFKII